MRTVSETNDKPQMKNHPYLLQVQTAWLWWGAGTASEEQLWDQFGYGFISHDSGLEGYLPRGKRVLGRGRKLLWIILTAHALLGKIYRPQLLPHQLASSTEPRQIRNNSPGPGPAGQLPARRRTWIDFTCGLTAASASELRGAWESHRVQQLSNERSPVKLSGGECFTLGHSRRVAVTQLHRRLLDTCPVSAPVPTLQELKSSPGEYKRVPGLLGRLFCLAQKLVSCWTLMWSCFLLIHSFTHSVYKDNICILCTCSCRKCKYRRVERRTQNTPSTRNKSFEHSDVWQWSFWHFFLCMYLCRHLCVTQHSETFSVSQFAFFHSMSPSTSPNDYRHTATF